MILRRLFTITILLTSTIWSQAQQINAVPDYVFRNQMSVGRNAVTDTAAYFSIGPRYGATKGFMPPIVGDTATFSSGKRNGLLIFSVQKNKFLYWDSVRVQWSDMAGGSGSYILAGDTSAMLAPYLRKADTTAMLLPYVRHAGYGLTKSGQSFLVDTLNIATRAWRQKGIDSVVSIIPAAGVGGSGTTNYVPKFTASTTIGNSQIVDNAASGVSIGAKTLIRDDGPFITGSNISGGANNMAIGTPTSGGFLSAYTNATERLRITSGGNVGIGTASPGVKLDVSQASTGSVVRFQGDASLLRYLEFKSVDVGAFTGAGWDRNVNSASGFHSWSTVGVERLRIFANGRVGINTTTDAGYQLNVNGTFNSSANYSYFGGDANTAIYMGSFSNEGRIGVGGRSSFPTAAMTFYTADGTNNFERMRISSAGDMGIGTSSPSYKLDINGTLRSVNGANFATTSGNVGIGTASPSTFLSSNGTMTINGGVPGLLLQEAGTLSGFFASNGTQLVIDARSTRDIDFQTSATVRLRIKSDGELLINTTTDAGDYKLQVAGNAYATGGLTLTGTGSIFTRNTANTSGFDIGLLGGSSVADAYVYQRANAAMIFATNNSERGRINSAGEWIIDASGTDAGDYKLQVVGNARVGTGKLDIASNTTFGIGVARSGTSEVAGQIYNSNGILYLGAESSAGGQIFSGSSAYAAVIGSGANYPLQFAANNITRATMTTNGNFMIGFPTDTYFYRLQVNGSIFSNNQIIAQNAAAQLNIDSSTNISPLYISNQSLTGSSAQGLFYGSTTWNTTGNPSLIDLAITNTASGATSNYIKISDGSNIFRVTKAAEVVTAAPTGGSIRKWKLGEAATVSPTSPNRTIRVEIDGTVYYLHAKTTND